MKDHRGVMYNYVIHYRHDAVIFDSLSSGHEYSYILVQYNTLAYCKLQHVESIIHKWANKRGRNSKIEESIFPTGDSNPGA